MSVCALILCFLHLYNGVSVCQPPPFTVLVNRIRLPHTHAHAHTHTHTSVLLSVVINRGRVSPRAQILRGGPSSPRWCKSSANRVLGGYPRASPQASSEPLGWRRPAWQALFWSLAPWLVYLLWFFSYIDLPGVSSLIVLSEVSYSQISHSNNQMSHSNNQ